MRLINTMRLIAKVRLTTRVYGMSKLSPGIGGHSWIILGWPKLLYGVCGYFVRAVSPEHIGSHP